MTKTTTTTGKGLRGEFAGEEGALLAVVRRVADRDERVRAMRPAKSDLDGVALALAEVMNRYRDHGVTGPVALGMVAEAEAFRLLRQWLGC